MKVFIVFCFVLIVTLLVGCTAMNTLSAGLVNKNFAWGSETKGGSAEVTVTGGENGSPLTFSLWGGVRRVWGSSTIGASNADKQASIVSASKAGTTTVKLSQYGIEVGDSGNGSSSVTNDAAIANVDTARALPKVLNK